MGSKGVSICCPLCGGTAELLRDKAGRPTMWCSWCRSRAFLSTRAALVGLQLLAREVAANREAWRGAVQAELERDAQATPDTAPEVDEPPMPTEAEVRRLFSGVAMAAN